MGKARVQMGKDMAGEFRLKRVVPHRMLLIQGSIPCGQGVTDQPWKLLNFGPIWFLSALCRNQQLGSVNCNSQNNTLKKNQNKFLASMPCGII